MWWLLIGVTALSLSPVVGGGWLTFLFAFIGALFLGIYDYKVPK